MGADSSQDDSDPDNDRETRLKVGMNDDSINLEMSVISFHEFIMKIQKNNNWFSSINVCTPEVYQSVRTWAVQVQVQVKVQVQVQLQVQVQVQWPRVPSRLGYGHPKLDSATATAFL